MPCGKDGKAYSAALFAALGGFLLGYHTGVISGVLTMTDFIQKMNLEQTDDDRKTNTRVNAILGGIVGVVLLGCFLGSLIGGQASDRFSRKYSMSIFSIVFTLGAALQTWAPKPYFLSLLIGRFFTALGKNEDLWRIILGVSIGALSMIVPIYHSEIAIPENRGRMSTLQQGAITLGIAISFLVNILVFVSSDNEIRAWHWRVPFGIQMIPSSILAVGILFFPHSPRWLISHDREEEAKAALMTIRSMSYDEIDEEFIRIRNEVAYLREYEVETYRQLFRPPLLRLFLLGIGIQVLQQLTGINSAIYYTPRILDSYSYDAGPYSGQKLSFIVTGIYGCVNVVFTIPTMILIDRLGRRMLLMIGAAIMSISMLIVAICIAARRESSDSFTSKASDTETFIIIVFVGIFVGGFAFSWGPVPWLFCTEIFPLTMRAKATSLTTAANWATNCALSFLIPTLLAHLSYGLFLMFAALCATMILIVYRFYPETKGTYLEQNSITVQNRTLVPQLFENRRNSYSTFPEQSIVNRTENPTVSEQNLFNQPDQVNNLDRNDER